MSLDGNREFIALWNEINWTIHFLATRANATYWVPQCYYSEEGQLTSSRSWEIVANSREWKHGIKILRENSRVKGREAFYRFITLVWENGHQRVLTTKNFFSAKDLFSALQAHIEKDLMRIDK